VLVVAVTEPLWTSITVSLAPVVVALVALWVGAKQQNKTLRQQSRHDDLAEARTVLDDAARALHEADKHRRDLIGAYHDKAKRQALAAAGSELDEMTARIEIRFGREHLVTKTFSASVEAVLALYQSISDIRLEDDSPAASREFKSVGAKFEGELRPAFVDAAVAYTRVDLEDREASA
jgi:hypothetical protein